MTRMSSWAGNSLPGACRLCSLLLALVLLVGCQPAAPKSEASPHEVPAWEQEGLLSRAPSAKQLRAPAAVPEPPRTPLPQPAAPEDTAKVSITRRSNPAHDASAAEELPVPPKPKAEVPERTMPAAPRTVQLAGLRWRGEVWADAAVLETQESPPGLVVRLQEGQHGKAACTATLQTPQPADHITAVTVQAHTTAAESLSLACFVRCGQAMTYLESPGLPLGAEPRALTFPLARPAWKAESTSWKHSAKAQGQGELREIGFVIYGKAAGATVLLEHPQLIPTATKGH